MPNSIRPGNLPHYDVELPRQRPRGSRLAETLEHSKRLRPTRASALALALALLGSLPLPLQAQLGARPAEAWIKVLESTNRLEDLKIDETVAELKLKPGDQVADIGAGSGVFCPALARAVSPGGRVYAVDIEQGLIDHIAQRAKELNLTNIEPVLGRFTDPNLPVRNLDLAFMYDVLHHIEHRAEYLQHLAPYLNTAGRVAVIDLHPDRGPHPNQPELQVTKAQADAWMAAVGFLPTQEFDLFDDKWFVIYSRQEPQPSTGSSDP